MLKTLHKRLLTALVIGLLCSATAEISLRVFPQPLHRFLESIDSLDLPSPEYNHRPPVGPHSVELPEHSSATMNYDRNGLRLYSRNRNDQRRKKLKILYFGDSFMQGGAEVDSLPYIADTIL